MIWVAVRSRNPQAFMKIQAVNLWSTNLLDFFQHISNHFLPNGDGNLTTLYHLYQAIWITVTVINLPLHDIFRFLHQLRNTVKHTFLPDFPSHTTGTSTFCCTSKATSSSSALTSMEIPRQVPWSHNFWSGLDFLIVCFFSIFSDQKYSHIYIYIY